MALPGNTQLNCKVDKRSIQKLAQQQLCWLFWNNQTQSKLGLARVLAEKWEGCPPTPKSNWGLKAAVKLHLKGLMPSAEDRKLTLLGIAGRISIDYGRLDAAMENIGNLDKCSIRDFEICSTKYPFPTSYVGNFVILPTACWNTSSTTSWQPNVGSGFRATPTLPKCATGSVPLDGVQESGSATNSAFEPEVSWSQSVWKTLSGKYRGEETCETSPEHCRTPRSQAPLWPESFKSSCFHHSTTEVQKDRGYTISSICQRKALQSHTKPSIAFCLLMLKSSNKTGC